MRYTVIVRACAAGRTRGGQYRRPVTVRVLDTLAMQSEWHAVRGLGGCIFERSNVDSRYGGERSAYGQAIREAEALAHRLNSGQTMLLSEVA